MQRRESGLSLGVVEGALSHLAGRQRGGRRQEAAALFARVRRLTGFARIKLPRWSVRSVPPTPLTTQLPSEPSTLLTTPPTKASDESAGWATQTGAPTSSELAILVGPRTVSSSAAARRTRCGDPNH